MNPVNLMVQKYETRCARNVTPNVQRTVKDFMSNCESYEILSRTIKQENKKSMLWATSGSVVGAGISIVDPLVGGCYVAFSSVFAGLMKVIDKKFRPAEIKDIKNELPQELINHLNKNGIKSKEDLLSAITYFKKLNPFNMNKVSKSAKKIVEA